MHHHHPEAPTRADRAPQTGPAVGAGRHTDRTRSGSGTPDPGRTGFSWANRRGSGWRPGASPTGQQPETGDRSGERDSRISSIVDRAGRSVGEFGKARRADGTAHVGVTACTCRPARPRGCLTAWAVANGATTEAKASGVAGQYPLPSPNPPGRHDSTPARPGTTWRRMPVLGTYLYRPSAQRIGGSSGEDGDTDDTPA